MNLTKPLVMVRGLQKYFPLKKRFLQYFRGGPIKYVKAVDDISFDIFRGEILGFAGESGSGKTTVGELLVRLKKPSKGEIKLDGQNIAQLVGTDLQNFRRHSQIIFQDPYESLNPGYTIFRTVVGPLINFQIGNKQERMDRVCKTLERTELRPPEDYLYRFPHQMSGGQRQRVAIARAIVCEPDLLVADEPVSMLDVSIRAGVLNLLKSLNQKMGLTILYITHDLSTLKYVCDRVAIMYLGKIVEIGNTAQILARPLHPYTKALIAAVPRIEIGHKSQVVEIFGQIESPIDLPMGCRFRSRCPKAKEICRQKEPELLAVDGNTMVACYLYFH